MIKVRILDRCDFCDGEAYHQPEKPRDILLNSFNFQLPLSKKQFLDEI